MKHRKSYKGMPYWSPAAIAEREADYRASLKKLAEKKERERRKENENSR